MSRYIYIRSHEFHQFNLFEIGSCCVNCDKQMEKKDDAFCADGLRGKVTCYLRGNSKLGLFWLENMGAECGEIPVFIPGSIYGVEGGLYS